MRKPDIHTYESWFLDFLDGNLSREEHALLQEFLNSNPELAEELEEMSTEPLPADYQTYPHAKTLLKSVGDLEGDAFEEYCIAALEGDLEDEEKQAFYKSLRKDKFKEQVFRQYKEARLRPEPIIYPYKKTLLKKQLSIRIIPYALPVAAAAALLLFMLLPLRNESMPEPTNSISSIGKVLENSETETESQLQKVNPSVIHQEIPEPLLVKTELPLPEKKIQAKTTELKTPSQLPVRREMLAWAPMKGIDQVSLTDGNMSGSGSYSIIPSGMTDNQSANYLTLWRRISKGFRQITQPEKQVPSDEPLKLIEVADAGINGINKLLGWNVDFRTHAGDDQPDD